MKGASVHTVETDHARNRANLRRRCWRGPIRLAVPLVFFLLSVVSMFNPPPSKAEPPVPGFDVRMVIDISGSMKRNDPENLRRPAVDLLARLLPENSRAGVWTFGQQVNMLMPHQNVDDGWRELASNKAEQINSAGLYTNIGAALEKAAEAPADDGFNKSIILLTDGMVDISKDPEENRREWRRIVDEVIPALRADGTTVHTIALSDDADAELMEKLAVATDGIAAVAKDADQLMQAFLKAFDVAAPAQQVPMTDNRFVVDSRVEEFTALIFRQTPDSTHLISPDGTQYSSLSKDPGISWYLSGSYDLITVRNPLEGQWRIEAEVAPNSRVTVVSDLQLRVGALPNNAVTGHAETLRFALQDSGITITDHAFLSILNNSSQLQYGKHDDAAATVWRYDFPQGEPPEDGVYRVDLPAFDSVGVYELSILVDGKTFQRRYRQNIEVRGPFSAELVEKVDSSGARETWISVRSHLETIDPQKTQVAATVVSPLRRKWVVPLVLNDGGQWQGPARMDKPGEYTVRVHITGEDKNNEEFEYNLKPLVVGFEPGSFDVLPTSQSSIASSASSSSASSQSPTEPVLPEVPVDEPERLPPWIFYMLLGITNLAIMIGGYYLYKKLFSEERKHDEQDEIPGSVDDPEQGPELDEETMPPPVNDFDDDMLAMDTGGGSEDEPPMEDFDLSAPVEDDMSPIEDDVASEDTPDLPGVEEDAETDKAEPEGDNDLYVVEEDDLLNEMLKTQGVEEDELDDAITSLIEELAGTGESADDLDDVSEDEDDFDFDDDDRV